MKYVDCAEGRRIEDNQGEHRDNCMARPRFAGVERVSNQSHKAANAGHKWRRNVQPFRAADSFATHDMWPDVHNRQQDR